MRKLRLVGFVASIATAACATSAANDVAAVIVNPDAASRAALRSALSEAMGVARIALADDALTGESVLIIEPVRLRSPSGERAQGRETRPPERFRLIKLGRQCWLVHERTGKRWLLGGTTCAPMP